MMTTCMTYAPRVAVRRTFNHSVTVVVPPLLQADADALRIAVSSGVQGEAFTRLLEEMGRCNSIVTAIGALYENGTKISGHRAWVIDNRFGFDLTVIVASETFAHNKLFINLRLAVKAGSILYDISPWAVVEIDHS